MPIQVGKMILFGILTALFYIAVPLILFGVLETMGIMTFSQAFKTSVIIIGVVGVIFSMLSHAWPKDTSANRIIAFISSIYSGVYLFYIFGGFNPGVSLGTYQIDLPMFQVLLGLQLIAWLFLGSAGIRALQYLIEAIELRKKKEYSLKGKKQFKISKFFKFLGMILSLVILGYFGSLIYSGMNLGFAIDPINPGDITYDDGGTPLNTTDDTFIIPMTFDLDNQGIYAIYNVYLDVEINTLTTANPADLPENTKIGESLTSFYGTYHSFTTSNDQLINISIFPMYALGLANTSATLELVIYFNTQYAGIEIDLSAAIQTPWTELF